jgi:hypothetical protein
MNAIPVIDLRDEADDIEDAARAEFSERYGVHPL